MICFDGKFRVLQMSRYKSHVKIQDRLFYTQNLGMMISNFKNSIGAYCLPSHNTVKNHIHELQGFWSMLWRFVSLGIAGYIKVGVSYT